MLMNPRFYFAACQTGAEKAVKAEVLAECPQLRFAFSRPGFITFKEPDDAAPALVLKKAIFTRLWGEVVFQTRDRATLPELLAQIPSGAVVQCFDRDEFIPGDEPADFIRNGHIREVMRREPALKSAGVPVVGVPVFSVIWVDDFHLFLTRHIHSDWLAPAPGNIPDISLPVSAPSRAWLKIEEAIYRFKPKLESGERVLEVGCAPGGATTALMNRGLLVTGIDPQNMDEHVSRRDTFTSIRKFARYVTGDDLRSCNPDILVMDMSIPPGDALAELAHVINVLRELYGKNLKLRCGLLTLKLNDWKIASAIPMYLKRLEQIGFHDLETIQLASNRQEFFVRAGRFA